MALCVRCERPLLGASGTYSLSREGTLDDVCRLCYQLARAQLLAAEAQLTASEADIIASDVEGVVRVLEEFPVRGRPLRRHAAES